MKIPARRGCSPAGGGAARRPAGACAWTAPPPDAAAAGAQLRGARQPRARPSPTCASAAHGPARAAAAARGASRSHARICAQIKTTTKQKKNYASRITRSFQVRETTHNF